jgi:hypothetical protein
MFNFLKKEKQEQQEKSLYEQVFTHEFENFTQAQLDRVLINLGVLDSETSKYYADQIPGGWINMHTEGKHAYYPFEVLEAKEQQHILQGDEYQVMSFVQPNALGVAPYQEPGVEVMTRVKSKAMLPKFLPESEMNYHTIKQFYTAKDLPSLVKQLEGVDSVDNLVTGLAEGIASYHTKTEELFRKDKPMRDFALYKLDERNAPADAYLFADMRKNIAQANKASSYQN